ncbi:phosphoribosyltransferase [Chthonobacter albigriseus]|uniref:phosphoribosyltransferase n=1 Tax=Chthonobacter albigriseus TaxID=1683161 RepID=UPI0015EF6AD8|nr:phosphoribosyltransferase [Chthonobacter albigriseus]
MLKADYRGNLFDVIADRAGRLNAKQRALFTELVARFTYINNYNAYIFDICTEIESILTKNGKYIISPLVSYRPSKVKSGEVVFYDITTTIRVPRGIELKKERHPASKKMDYSNVNTLIIVDDFIGTGDQLLSLYSHLRERGLNASKLHVFTIVACRQAISRIEYIGANISTRFIIPPAIRSGSGIGELSIQNAYDVYETIISDKKIRKTDNTGFGYGYGRSEALVCLKRVPNNTLAIFWNEWTDGRRRWPAIFPR